MALKINKRQYSSRNCFVCGTENEKGLNSRFYETETGELIGIARTCFEHQSYPGRTHGGITSSLLDEAIGRAISVGKEENIWGVTLELTVRYRKPVPYDKDIKVIARVTEDRGRIFEGTAEIILPDGQVAAEAKGRYLKQTAEKITNDNSADEEWFYIQEEPLPEYIDI